MNPDQNNIHVVVASDNHYAILIAPLIKSIEANHKTFEKINFYIIDDGISLANRRKVQASVNPEIVSLYWKKSSDIVPPDVKIPVDHTAFPLTAYLRLFAPYVVPANVTRVLYVDVDMIVQRDISELWHTDIEGKLFGAVQDHQKVVNCSWGGIPNYQQLGIPAETKYFNSGLLLIDKKRWIEEHVPTRVIKCMNDNMKFVNYADQYGLNAELYNQWHELDPRWNSAAAFDHSDPFIIHFLDVKPIFKSYNSKKQYQETFYNYLRQTAWKNFTPRSDYRRLLRKVYNKLKKVKFKLS